MGNDTHCFTSTNVPKGISILVGLTILFSFVTASFLAGSVAYDLEMQPEDYLGLLTHLAMISLIIERFVEIFTSVIRKPNRIKLVADLRVAKTKSMNEENKAIEALDMYRAKTGIFALSISFVTGLIIASVGVHVLEPLFVTSELTLTQSRFFGAIDIIITAGLIAGGSKGVNALTSSIGAVFDAMKYQARATQREANKDIE